MKKKVIIILGVLVLIGITTFGSYSYIKVKQWDSLILPTVKIEDVDLTGKTKLQAQTILKDKYSDKVIKKKITIVTDNKNYTLDYSMLGAKYNIDEALEQATSYGYDMNIFEKYKVIKKPITKDIKLTFEYNDKGIDTLLSKIAKDTNKDSVNATLTMAYSGKFNVTNDSVGNQLDTGKLKEEINSKINGGLSQEVISITAPVKEIAPKVTTALLKTVDTKISSYDTNFASSASGRATNIDLSTKIISGTLLMPGDVFSFNGVVGERTQARGYKTAGVIIGDKLEQGLGGGICQTSSTLYNAILLTGLESVERIHHTISSGYIPKGQDATVDYGNLDYKFKNTFDYPVYIEGTSSNRTLKFNIYSNSKLTNKTYKIKNEVNGITQPTTQTIEDPTKYVGQNEIVKTGYAGFKVKLFRETYENGKLTNTEVISNDTFKVINGVVKIGTKK